MRERGPGPVANMAADDERRHIATTEQLQHENLEVTAREHIIFQSRGSIFNG